jgi:hypothetical protein
MTQRLLFLSLLVFALSGCLTHWVVDTETRLQLDNRTSFAVANLRVVADDGSLPQVEWIPDTLLPNSRSRVYQENMVGKFHFALSVRDSTCGDSLCWSEHSLGIRSVGGGSILWRLEIVTGNLQIEAK